MKREQALKEDLQQRWRKVSNDREPYYKDQFGFQIYYGKSYRLTWKGKPYGTFFDLQTAKLVATIVLNDYVMNRQ